MGLGENAGSEESESVILRPPSLTKPWEEYVSCDKAFKQPPDLPKDEASEEERAEFKAAAEDYFAKLEAARTTGDWSALLIPGQAPTKFVLLQVDRNLYREWLDRSTLPFEVQNRIGPTSLAALLVRVSLKSISGWDAITRERDPRWGVEMATPDIINELDAVSPRIVGELATRIQERLRGAGPL